MLALPRSTLYARQAAESAPRPAARRRRGRKPKAPDALLLDAIRAILSAPAFAGDGHRKVWERLRNSHGIRAARARVLRLMRENGLLSPFRRARPARAPESAQ
ncbi:MAG: IS3 family transposase [Candidatus Accumulibacter sp.]|nr:IS3 family transposase [Accumulibacter sp.]